MLGFIRDNYGQIGGETQQIGPQTLFFSSFNPTYIFLRVQVIRAYAVERLDGLEEEVGGGNYPPSPPACGAFNCNCVTSIYINLVQPVPPMMIS